MNSCTYKPSKKVTAATKAEYCWVHLASCWNTTPGKAAPPWGWESWAGGKTITTGTTWTYSAFDQKCWVCDLTVVYSSLVDSKVQRSPAEASYAPNGRTSFRAVRCYSPVCTSHYEFCLTPLWFQLVFHRNIWGIFRGTDTSLVIPPPVLVQLIITVYVYKSPAILEHLPVFIIYFLKPSK